MLLVSQNTLVVLQAEKLVSSGIEKIWYGPANKLASTCQSVIVRYVTQVAMVKDKCRWSCSLF